MSSSSRSSSPPNSQPFPIKRQQRLIKNRSQAKASRYRKKAKLLALELQVRHLTAEAKSLRAIGAYPEMFAGNYGHEVFSLFRRLEDMLKQQETSEKDIDEVLDECRDKVGVAGMLRTQSLRETFKETVDMMVPEYAQFTANISRFSGIFPEFLKSNEIAQYQLCVQYCKEQHSALISDLEAFKEEIGTICHSADLLNATLEGIRPLLSPRQMAYFALWVKRYYMGLSPQQVLSDGRNSTQLLA